MEGERAIPHARRYRQIAAILARHGLGYLVDRLGLGRSLPFHRGLLGHPRRRAPYTRPEHVRMALEELGATFVKLGQILSTRPDLVPPDYQAELAKLQDAVPPVPSDAIMDAIAAELGRPVAATFATFDPQPIAAASIGQAHAATLPDGTAVIVKVRRPGVVARVEADLEILHDLAARASRHREIAGRYDLVRLVQEFSASLRAELDYLHEGRNAERVAANFADDPTVRIPRIYWETTTARVLTLERMHGMKVTETAALAASGIDRRALAERAARVTLKMIFADGFFHADPHPGNFFIEPGGRLALIDFGMIGVVDTRTREQLAGIILAVTRKDADRLVDAFVELGFARGPIDRAGLGQDLHGLLARYLDRSLGEIALGPLLTETMAIARRHRLHLPVNLSLLLKTLIMSEGLAARLDPDFRLTAVLAPYARDLMRQQYAPERLARRVGEASLDAGQLALALPTQLRRLLGDLERGGVVMGTRLEDAESLLGRIERLANRLTLGMILAAFIVGLAVLMAVYHPGGNAGWIGALFAIGFTLALLLGGALAWSILRSGRR